LILTFDKQNIILLHGALGSSKTFDAFLPLISGQFNIHTFDFRGHGIYASDNFISSEILCQQLINFIESNKLKSVSIFGYSMGGYIALMTCVKRPDLIGKVITLATKFEWNTDIASYEIRQLNLLLDLPEDHPLKKQMLFFHDKKNFSNCIGLVGNLMLELGNKNYLNSYSYKQISNKVILLLGELDKMVSLDETKLIVNDIPNAELIILPNTKHPFEKVDAIYLTKLIEKFLL